MAATMLRDRMTGTDEASRFGGAEKAARHLAGR
jgi:hypothetical protein